MEGILAVAGFWTFMIVLILRRKGSAKPANPVEIDQLKSRINTLEQQLNAMTTQMLELKDGHEFTMKLLTDKQGSQKSARPTEKS